MKEITLSENIVRLRKSKGITQEQLANAVNVTFQSVSKWENGSSEPSTTNLIAIGKLYEIPPEELLKKLV